MDVVISSNDPLTPLKRVPVSMSIHPVSVIKSASKIPDRFMLSQNYPNPFNPSTKINFSLNQTSNVSVKIYDARGALVKTLIDGSKNSGSYDLTWDGTNNSGARLATGVYFYELKSDNNQLVKKMLLLK